MICGKTTLLLDNANPFLFKYSMPDVPHLQSDLALCDFGLFPELIMQLKDLQFETIEEIQTKSLTVLNSFTVGKKLLDLCVL